LSVGTENGLPRRWIEKLTKKDEIDSLLKALA
jgi:hypothetical protein